MKKICGSMAIVATAAVAALAGCGAAPTATAPTTPPSTPPVTAAAVETTIPSGPLDVQEACRAFTQVLGDYAMSDEQSFEAYSDIAGRTQDPALATAIRDVATGFEQHQASISDVQVQRLCGGDF